MGGKACLNCLGPFPTWSRMPFLTFASQPGALQVPGLQGGESVVHFLGTLVGQSPTPHRRHLPSCLSSNRTSWPKGNQQRTERQELWKRNLTISLKWPRYQLESLPLGELPNMLSGFPRSRDPGSQLPRCCILPLDWPAPNPLC